VQGLGGEARLRLGVTITLPGRGVRARVRGDCGPPARDRFRIPM